MSRDHIALLADGHLTVDDGPRADRLVSWLERLGDSCSAIYILGDLFEVWLGVDATDPARARVGSTLCALRDDGVRTVYVEGNRDFSIGRGATAGLFDVVVERDLIERVGETTLHLSHGDLINVADRPYRAWRRLSKGLLAPVALRLLPAATAVALADRLEVRLRSTNRRHKSFFPRDLCIAHARRQVAAGADVVAVGHFHRYEVVPVVADGRRGTFISLPFWHDEPRPLLLDRAGRLSEAS